MPLAPPDESPPTHLRAQEAELSTATKEAPERETRRSSTQLQRASIVDTIANSDGGALPVTNSSGGGSSGGGGGDGGGGALTAVLGRAGTDRQGSKVSGLLKLAIAAQVTTQVMQKAGAQYRKGQEAELSEADRDRPRRQSGSQMTAAAAGPSCAAKRRGTAPGYLETPCRPASYYLPADMLLRA